MTSDLRCSGWLAIASLGRASVPFFMDLSVLCCHMCISPVTVSPEPRPAHQERANVALKIVGALLCSNSDVLDPSPSLGGETAKEGKGFLNFVKIALTGQRDDPNLEARHLRKTPASADGQGQHPVFKSEKRNRTW